MYFRSDDEKYGTILKLSLFALYILAGFDLIIIALGYYLAQTHTEAASSITFVRNVIFFIAVADFIAIFILKKKLLKNVIQSSNVNPPPNVGAQYSELLRITIIITAMCAALPIYGLVLVILGEKVEILLLFVAMSLVGYQFFRLRARDFENDAE
jgi:hypothetical protein